MVTTTPITLSKTGANLTGTDGTANRTYVIVDTDILTGGMAIVVEGTSLQLTTDFTYTESSATITFLNIIDDSDDITITYFVNSVASATTASTGSTLSLIRFLRLLKTIPDKDSTSVELVGVGNDSTSSFWLDFVGVLSGTYTISYGAAATSTTAMTEDTHYTIDLDTSEITLTSAGITLLSTSNLYAAYYYNSLEIRNSELLQALSAAQDRVLIDTGQTFTDTTDLSYKKLTNQVLQGHVNTYNKVYDTYFQPIVKLQTTTNGAFTLGGTEITLTDSSLFPSTGTIYIDGNKVTYTDNTSNVLTVPATTPTIADDSVVRGEVIELSVEHEGSSPSYSVLDPDTEYKIDYDEGRVKILSNAYWSEVDAESSIYPTNYLIKISYMHAWHEVDSNVSIPDEIQYCIHAIAARNLMGAVVANATEAGLNDFNPGLINVDYRRVQEILSEYSTLNVGTSTYNKQRLT